MKRRIQVNLSERAHRELKRRAEAAGVTRQALIEGWLTEGPTDTSPDLDDTQTNSLSAEAKTEREAKKAAKKACKTELASRIADALPGRVMAIADKVETARPHKFHSGASPIPGCNSCADLTK